MSESATSADSTIWPDLAALESTRTVRFDLDEWHREYPGEKLGGISVDILDLGYWDDEGAYTEPAADWRQVFKRERSWGT